MSLASIQIIKNILPHDNADNLELAIIGGWQSIVKKNEFKQGDMVCYIEIDACLPVDEKYEFLRKCCFKKSYLLGEIFRVRTVKLRGKISQGLILPLSELYKGLNVGEDLTEKLGIKKWEVPINADLAGIVEGPFPSYVPKTDQIRVQNLELDLLPKVHWIIDEKLNGTSCSVSCFKGKVQVCSRNWAIKPGENVYYQATKDFHERLINKSLNSVIQGEIVGPGIQGNPYNLSKPKFYAFDVWDIDKQRYLSHIDRLEFLLIFPEISRAPYVGAWNFVEEPFNLDVALNQADGRSLLIGEKGRFSEVLREGVVYRTFDYVEGKIQSFKIISNQYLLENDQ